MKRLHLDDVRDLMCIENPSLTIDEAVNILQLRFPKEKYEDLLERARIVEEVRRIAKSRPGSSRPS